MAAGQMSAEKPAYEAVAGVLQGVNVGCSKAHT